MRNLSEAEQHNFNWLKSVVAENSGYTEIFKCYAQKNIEKFESLE
jgi:hypothetical protein